MPNDSIRADRKSAVDRLIEADRIAAESAPYMFRPTGTSESWLRRFHQVLAEAFPDTTIRASRQPDERIRASRGIGFTGISNGANDKIYLTAQEIVSYGVVSRGKFDPKVTTEDVSRAISDLGLEPHGLRDGQHTYDPVPIRLELSNVKPKPLRIVLPGTKYIPVAAELRDRIKSGQYDRLPPQKKLMTEFAVSNSTIRNAIDMLRDEGLIFTVSGKGTFVVPGNAAK